MVLQTGHMSSGEGGRGRGWKGFRGAGGGFGGMVVVFAGGGRGEGGWLVVEGMGVCRESGSVVVGGRAVVWVVDGYCRVGGCPGLGRAVEGRYLWCRGVVLPVGFCLRLGEAQI